jgi:D-sedoheptulose 7-phosphate isomerase
MMRDASGTAAYADYAARLQRVLERADWRPVEALGNELLDCWRSKRQVFLCGNGGSAGNAVHLANDFLYGVSKAVGSGLRVHALSANAAVLTCLANDAGYETIFAAQLAVQAMPGDVLVVLSGSGNSPNILQAKAMADVAIHFPVDDMQISEDLQLIAGHMIMQWLYSNRPQQSS